MFKFILFILLSLTNVVQAHIIMGVNQELAARDIKIVEDYFYGIYGIKLEQDIAVINEPNIEAYRKRIEGFKVNDAAVKATRSQAITSQGRAIVIDCGRLSNQEYLFFLAHEMVHQYQFQLRGKSAFNDLVMLEGLADLEAAKISDYRLVMADYKIPYEDLKSYADCERAIAKYGGDKVAKQIRYYVRNMDFGDYMAMMKCEE